MEQPNSITDPWISPALHPIPQNCCICGTEQFNGISPTDAGAPYGDGSGIEDLCLDRDRALDGLWTVCHVVCKHWFRDETVNRLVELAGDRGDPTRDAEHEYDVLHEAIRESISSDHGEDVLIGILGPGLHIPNPTADALGFNG